MGAVSEAYQRAFREGYSDVEANLITKSGEAKRFYFTGVRLVIDGKTYITGIGIDITERQRAEEQRRRLELQILHAQKLESLGILAGGIAHDFNNILAGIIGYTELALAELPDADRVEASLGIIKKASQRAADLVRQMLAYSGKGQFVVGPVNLSAIVEELQPMLAVSISKRAVLHYDLRRDLPAIEADATQMRQVVMNLVINASESLGEDAGAISVSTDVVRYGENVLTGLDENGTNLPAGTYVRLTVVDNGCGIDEATLKKIFEPFFTTKFTGRGLGLAAVHGIVRSQRGTIQVASQPGKGTTFAVFFPARDATSV
jgi:signal transduction histidine kinase